MQLLKLLLKILNCKAGNEVPLSLRQLLVVQTIENSFASYLYAVLGWHIWLLPPLPAPPFHSHPVRAQGLAL